MRRDDCSAARLAHTAADAAILKAGWLRQAFRGGCPERSEDCHTYCHACSSHFANITRLEVIIHGWDERDWRTAWVSEDLIAALGMRKHSEPNQLLREYDSGNIGLFRKMASWLRAGASRGKLRFLGDSTASCRDQ